MPAAGSLRPTAETWLRCPDRHGETASDAGTQYRSGSVQLGGVWCDTEGLLSDGGVSVDGTVASPGASMPKKPSASDNSGTHDPCWDPHRSPRTTRPTPATPIPKSDFVRWASPRNQTSVSIPATANQWASRPAQPPEQQSGMRYLSSWTEWEKGVTGTFILASDPGYDTRNCARDGIVSGDAALARKLQ